MEVNLNDIKNDSLKKVDINEIPTQKEEERMITKNAAQESIMGQVDKACDRFVKNFEEEQRLKFQKEAEEKKNRGEAGELDQFMDDAPVSHPNYTTEIKSSIDFDTIPGEGELRMSEHIQQERKVIIGDKKKDIIDTPVINKEDLVDENIRETRYSQDAIDTATQTATIKELPKKPINPSYGKAIETKDPGEVLGDPKLSLNTDEFVGSVTDSEKIDDEDFDLILGEKIDYVAQQKEMINDIRSKINPITKPVDLAVLTVLKKPTFVNNALRYQDTERHVSDWPLFESKTLMSMESFTGTELEKIDSRNYPDRNKYNMFLDVYQNIFKHITSIKDKKEFTAWLKVLKFFDLNHLWFLVYKTTFERANIVPYICTSKKCRHKYVKEIKNILDMVKFKTPKDREEFDAIFNNSPSIMEPEYQVRREQITNDYVIDFRDPSVWNVIFENAILPEKFRVKYATLLNTISFIDSMYVIVRDAEGNPTGLSPIEFTRYDKDMIKDIMSRIYTYAKILESLNPDQKSVVDGIITDIHEEHESVSYMIPQDVCPKCGQVIEEMPATGEELVFTRQELVGMTLS